MLKIKVTVSVRAMEAVGPLHSAVSFTTLVEQFISKAQRRPISEFFGSNFCFFRELKFCFPRGKARTSQPPAFGVF